VKLPHVHPFVSSSSFCSLILNRQVQQRLRQLGMEQERRQEMRLWQETWKIGPWQRWLEVKQGQVKERAQLSFSCQVWGLAFPLQEQGQGQGQGQEQGQGLVFACV
jgi:hypothetical protein